MPGQRHYRRRSWGHEVWQLAVLVLSETPKPPSKLVHALAALHELARRQLLFAMSLLEILTWPTRCLWDVCNSQLLGRGALVHRSAAVQALYHKVAGCRQAPGTPPLSVHQRGALITSGVLDVLLGIAGGGFLLRHRGRLQALAAEASERLVDGVLTGGTEWLMSVAPAGLKLNEELDVFMGRAVLRILQIFSDFGGQHQALLLSSALWSLVISSPLGLSTLLALASDVLALATCHVSLLYWLSALIYSAQLRALAALWRLFRGRKRNPLRHRVDSFERHVEQIVVGSLLFTPLLLLLPTTWAYYSLFAMTYGGIAAARAALQIGSAVIRSFPLYRLAVWAAVPGACPSDVSFQVTSAGQKVVDETMLASGKVINGPGRVSRWGKEMVTSMGASVESLRVTSASRNTGTRTETGDDMFPRGQNEVTAEEGSVVGTRKSGVMGTRPRARERNASGEEWRDRKVEDGVKGTKSDEKRGEKLDGEDSACSLGFVGQQAEAKLAGVPSGEELAARHLRLELVTADAADVLRPFLRHVTSPFSLMGAAGVVVALCVGNWVDPVLTLDAMEF
ncbi:hypothetical protein KFL_004330110 [Klebsormidium nitens]|uniref:Uncharacterized protein n=1 Tax=Klebsormidium nitens TaxID=105231 RepID=A0A1Y1IC00_KLENI|nr:hypothetical protein KFL_004330110 [Klebsormidium nitens]|eukprot:GAQ88494.1 hypothetical protein KFL_004330110 [Klebsormidium nitens]